MENLFKDEIKINMLSQIQNSLCTLASNSSQEAINEIISKISPSYLTQKDELKVICQLFGYYARTASLNHKGKTINLFKEILPSIKIHLQDESAFFWDIFGGLFYYKLWMYEEGLISIQYIIQRFRKEGMNKTTEYFLPEIKEKAPDVYLIEVQPKLTQKYSEDMIEKFKGLRLKHFEWLQKSNDFYDSQYTEIETDPFRLSIKRDDVSTFQSILSKTNISVNSKISESLIENFSFSPDTEYSLIEYSAIYNSINIFKYLLMNDAIIDKKTYQSSIEFSNYEIIHIIENKLKEKNLFFLNWSILSWRNDLNEYFIDNFDHSYLLKSDVDTKFDSKLIDLIEATFYSINILFFKNYLIPFFKKNEKFIQRNSIQIISHSLLDNSCFFLKEWLKYPLFNFNFFNENSEIFINAIRYNRTTAVEILLNLPNVEFNKTDDKHFPPIFVACFYNSDLKIVKLLCDSLEDEKIIENDPILRTNPFYFSISQGNTFVMEYLDNRYPSLRNGVNLEIIKIPLYMKKLAPLSFLLKVFYLNNKEIDIDYVLQEFRKSAQSIELDLDLFDMIIQKFKEEVKK